MGKASARKVRQRRPEVGAARGAGRRARFSFLMSRPALLIGSAAFALLAIEAAFRLLDIRPRQLGPRQIQTLTENGWRTVDYWGTARLKRQSTVGDVPMGEYVPGTSFRFLYFDDSRDVDDPQRAVRIATAAINQHGLRGADFPAAKPAGVRRVLFVGDSITFGEGVDGEDTFCSLTERCLNAGASPPSFEVINAGISGYNTESEVIYLEKRWLAFDPDHVVLVFYLNDAYDDARFTALITGGGEEVHFRVAASRSLLLGWLRTRWQRHAASRRLTELYRSQFSRHAEIDGADWGSCQAALARAAELTRARNVTLSVVIFPELHALDRSHAFLDVYAQVRRYVESLGVEVLDLFPAFDGRRADDLWIHPTDHHPNEKAHRIAADAICPHVRAALRRAPERARGGAAATPPPRAAGEL